MCCSTLSKLPYLPSNKTDWQCVEEYQQLPDIMPDGSPWPKVSVITPSYNQGQFIEDTILSVKGQLYPNLEHIVVDGGSNDGTVDILRRYETSYNLSWTSEPDKGQSDAINKGFRRAQGEIIGWVNSDDTYLPGAVIKAVKYLLEHPDQGWVYGDGYWIDEQGRVINIKYSGPYSFKDLVCRGMYITQPAVFFRRAIFDEVGFLDEDIHTTMDYDFFLRIGMRFSAGYIPDILATRRLHSQAKTSTNVLDFYYDSLKSIGKLFASPLISDEIRMLKSESYFQRHWKGGVQAFKIKKFHEARQLLWRALKLQAPFWRKETWLALLLILESYLCISWISPGLLRHLSNVKFKVRNGDVFVNWTSQNDS